MLGSVCDIIWSCWRVEFPAPIYSCSLASAKDSHWGPRAKGVFHPPSSQCSPPVQRNERAITCRDALGTPLDSVKKRLCQPPALPHSFVTLDCCKVEVTERCRLYMKAGLGTSRTDLLGRSLPFRRLHVMVLLPRAL